MEREPKLDTTSDGAGLTHQLAARDKPGVSSGPLPSDPPRTPISELGMPERYRDLGAIARGGWGEVRRARDQILDRVVAIKILATEHTAAHQMRARFLNEARVTASLEHPGIVPVHDRGVLDDGRPWFTMKEVRGRTFHEVMRDPPGDDGAAPRLRRLVEILLRVAETVGYAHERGVLHRDLKPGNVMVGEFGEVLVLDWGIARTQPEAAQDRGVLVAEDAALTGTGDILGTVAYMSPEQARGIGEPLTAASDVFCLGLILHEILTGERARPYHRVQAWAMAAMGSMPPLTPSRDVPEELCTIVQRATRVEPLERPDDGMAFATLLRAWLDGSLRRERAAVLVTQAAATIGRGAALREARDQRREDARRILADVRDHDPVERKRPAWALEDEAAELDRQLEVLEAERVETLRAALELDPEHDGAHAALAALYRERVLDAEARRAPHDAARAEVRLRRHDRGQHARFLRGLGRLVLDTEPTSARVRASRFVMRERRYVTEAWRELGTTPIDVEIEAGSWLLELEHGGSVTRLPVRIERDRTWSSTRPGEATAQAIRCIGEGGIGSLAEGEIYVPPGVAPVGDDAHAVEPVPAALVWIEGFVIQRVAVTCAEYLSFLDEQPIDEATRHAPRWQQTTAHAPDAPLAAEHLDGRWRFTRPGESDVPIDLRWPISSIDWHAACAYASWLAAKTGLPWRLPDELEWEKAARGVDGRAYPWGDQGEPTWARIVGSTADLPCRAPVGTHPIDESPYGVRDMAGNVRTWCAGPWTPEGPPRDGGVLRRIECASDDASLRAVRGGSWSSVASLARSASRFAGPPSHRFSAVGLRLVRSVG
ncbi:MAG: bifunctional serine/threonine-protein kinase/formylglycine-generating enzyme family protein [Sandaracinus sp.]